MIFEFCKAIYDTFVLRKILIKTFSLVIRLNQRNNLTKQIHSAEILIHIDNSAPMALVFVLC